MAISRRLEDLHINRLQLFAYCSIGQTLLQKCLIEETLNCGLSANTNPFEALSEIFGFKKDQLKKLNNIFVNTSIKDLIYKDFDQDLFNPSINIFKLDISTLMELLTGIDAFRTSPKYAHGIQCKGQNHQSSCCKDCTHKCTNCGKMKCKGGKCCKANLKKCNHPCQKCSISDSICKHNYKVCCAACRLCLSCCLHLAKQNTVDDLIVNVGFGTKSLCSLFEIKVCVSLLLKLRNLTMHSTDTNFSAISIDLVDFPGVNDWKDLNTIICKVLNLMLKEIDPSIITSFDRARIAKDILDISKMVDKEELLRKYEQKIQTFGTFEHLFEIKTDLKQLDQSIQRLYSERQRLTFHVEFFFGENVNYDLDCKLAKNIKQVMKSKIKILFNDEYNLIANGLVTKDISTVHSLTLKFKITASSQDATDFSVYEEDDTPESIDLWNNISNVVMKEIPDLKEARRIYWELGSIIIGVALQKKVGLSWSSKDYDPIATQHLPFICYKLNKQYKGLLHFSSKAIPIAKTSNSIKTLYFEIVSNSNTNYKRMGEVTKLINDEDFFKSLTIDSTGRDCK